MWPLEDVEALKRLIDEKLSASQIAAKFSNRYTRNSIIGKAHRLGLRFESRPSNGTATRAQRRRARWAEKALLRPRFNFAAKRPPPEALPQPLLRWAI